MNFDILPKPPTSGDQREMYRWLYLIGEVLNGLKAAFIDHDQTQGLELSDDTDTDSTGYKHVTNAQVMVYGDHVRITDGNPHGTDHSMLENIAVLDPIDADTAQDKHLSNLQANKWETHVADIDGNPHGTNLAQLDDVVAVAVAVRDVLEWDGTDWVNVPNNSLSTVEHDTTLTGLGTAVSPLAINRLYADATAGAVTVNLTGVSILIIKTDDTANTVTIVPDGANTIMGLTSYVLTQQYESVQLHFSGTDFYHRV